MSDSHRIQLEFMVAWSTRLVVATAVFALSACEGTKSRAPDHVGTYALESVDGRPVPTDVDSQRMVSAEITLGADSAWTLTARSVIQQRSGAHDTVVVRNQGRYRLEGQTLSLVGQNAADQRPGKGTLTGAAITATEDGHLMVYRRRSTSP